MKSNNVCQVDLSVIDDNELSANQEDSFTYERLKKELQKYGMVELPVLRQNENGRYVVISGHHRIRAWRELGHSSVNATIVSKSLTREEEFNLVNNFNAIRGVLRRGQIVKIIRERRLDPTKIDVFKFPVDFMFQPLTKDDLQGADDDRVRLAKINDLSLEIAREIAKVLVDEKDEMITVLSVKDKAAAVIRIPFKSKKVARERAGSIKKCLQNALVGIDND